MPLDNISKRTLNKVEGEKDTNQNKLQKYEHKYEHTSIEVDERYKSISFQKINSSHIKRAKDILTEEIDKAEENLKNKGYKLPYYLKQTRNIAVYERAKKMLEDFESISDNIMNKVNARNSDSDYYAAAVNAIGKATDMNTTRNDGTISASQDTADIITNSGVSASLSLTEAVKSYYQTDDANRNPDIDAPDVPNSTEVIDVQDEQTKRELRKLACAEVERQALKNEGWRAKLQEAKDAGTLFISIAYRRLIAFGKKGVIYTTDNKSRFLTEELKIPFHKGTELLKFKQDSSSDTNLFISEFKSIVDAYKHKKSNNGKDIQWKIYNALEYTPIVYSGEETEKLKKGIYVFHNPDQFKDAPDYKQLKSYIHGQRMKPPTSGHWLKLGDEKTWKMEDGKWQRQENNSQSATSPIFEEENEIYDHHLNT